MIKKLENLVKFILIFSLICGLGAGWYFFLRTTEAVKIINTYHPKNIHRTCPDSPGKYLYLECFRRSLGRMIRYATPYDFLAIFRLEIKTYEFDKFRAVNPEKKIYSHLVHVENWSIILDFLKAYRLTRDKIDFFQVLLLPLVQKYLKEIFLKEQAEIKNMRKEVEPLIEALGLKERWSRAYNKVISTKFYFIDSLEK